MDGVSRAAADIPAVPDGYLRLARSLDPWTVSAALDVWGWTVVRFEADVKEVRELVDGAGAPRARVMVPLAPDYVDFLRRFADLLTALGIVYGLEPWELDARIAAARPE